ncbi:hypothetical protein POJ06DRAFT_270887 [Lipomyces tetrasporus]|uniref:Uncharacterized protein n=1 Tax=Lipomyces tetrasporus TaxID=54092 RepID=A0AAD7QNF9_9ASCO|nr:uncharacterized protein POJ06DRAFT_270887 [Lipomyces tetrasporus]KAJ8098076.1 hypothetical protein POJ06DRAFT_270887 [Lipomyces tetrasporus]
MPQPHMGTGAAGFIDQLVAKELLSDPKYKVTLTDVIEPPVPAGALYSENATVITTDLLRSVSSVVDKSLDAVYIFHGIMSSGSEENFDLVGCVIPVQDRSLVS